jgi:hypothetical protein
MDPIASRSFRADHLDVKELMAVIIPEVNQAIIKAKAVSAVREELG